MNEVASAKSALRREMRARRKALPDQAERSQRLWAHVRALDEVVVAQTVMAFSSVNGEPQTESFIDWCRAEGKRVMLPEDDPRPDPMSVDVVIVPGIAFTAGGDRLGQGGGWYDRFLAEVRPECVTVGVGFAPQLVDSLPVEPLDVALHLVVMDDGVAIASRRKTGSPDLAANISETLGVLLRSLLPITVRSGVLAIDAGWERTISDAERSLVANAVATRRAEFATGRTLLRDLVGQQVEILRDGNGGPAWPSGLVGSLAHDSAFAIGVIASERTHSALGIDIEPDVPMGSDVGRLVLGPEDEAPDAVTAFVAKEAVYKAWSGAGGEMLEHHDVRLTVAGSSFGARVGRATTMSGRFGRAGGRLVAAVAIPAT